MTNTPDPQATVAAAIKSAASSQTPYNNYENMARAVITALAGLAGDEVAALVDAYGDGARIEASTEIMWSQSNAQKDGAIKRANEAERNLKAAIASIQARAVPVVVMDDGRGFAACPNSECGGYPGNDDCSYCHGDGSIEVDSNGDYLEAANPDPDRACVDREALLAEIDRRIASNEQHRRGYIQLAVMMELQDLRAHIESLVTGGGDGKG